MQENLQKKLFLKGLTNSTCCGTILLWYNTITETKGERKMKKFDIIGWVFTSICALFLLWFLYSWIDVVDDNCSPNPQHSDLNLFVLMTESVKEDEPQGTCGDPLSVFDVTTGLCSM